MKKSEKKVKKSEKNAKKSQKSTKIDQKAKNRPKPLKNLKNPQNRDHFIRGCMGVRSFPRPNDRILRGPPPGGVGPYFS